MNAARLREYVQVYNIDMDCSVVAVDSNEILGLAMLGIREKRAWITRLGVIRGKRRQGTNSRLVTHLLKQACHKFASSPWPIKARLIPNGNNGSQNVGVPGSGSPFRNSYFCALLD